MRIGGIKRIGEGVRQVELERVWDAARRLQATQSAEEKQFTPLL